MPRRKLATLTEASNYTGLGERTIRRYISTGRLIGYRIGPKAIRVDLDEVDALVQPIPTVRSA
jgi:excisionase family DNA binding protein